MTPRGRRTVTARGNEVYKTYPYVHVRTCVTQSTVVFDVRGGSTLSRFVDDVRVSIPANRTRMARDDRCRSLFSGPLTNRGNARPVARVPYAKYRNATRRAYDVRAT